MNNKKGVFQMDKRCEIIDLYCELQREINRIMPDTKGTSGIVLDYAKTLSSEKREMLNAIRVFRNHWAFDSHLPQCPDNYREWIKFLKNEISSLKTISDVENG